MNLSFIYKKIAEAICRAPKMRIHDILLMESLLPYGSFEDVKVILERMLEHGWIYKKPLFELKEFENVPEIREKLKKFSAEHDYYLHGFTNEGREKFRDVIEEVEAGYKLYYSFSKGGIYSLKTDTQIIKINRNAPIYIALGLVYETGNYSVKQEEIVERHREYDPKSSIKRVEKSLNNFRPRFLESLTKAGICINSEGGENFSLRQDFVVIPSYLKVTE